MDHERTVSERVGDFFKGALAGVAIAGAGITVATANVWAAEYVAGNQMSLVDTVGEGSTILGVAALAGVGAAAVIRHFSSARD